MRKVGVLVTFNLLILSSVILVFSLNTAVNLTPLDPNDEIIEDIDKTPQSSSSGPWDYSVHQSTYMWYDLKNDPSATNISWSFTNGRDNGWYSHATSFGIELYESTYWNLYICTNGYISLTDASPDEWWNYPFPRSGGLYSHMIAPFWDNINLNNGGEVFVRDFAGDKIVIEYKNVYHNNFNQIGSFEVVLLNDSTILFNYEDINYIADGYTCGINYGDGDLGTEYKDITASTAGLTLNWTYPQQEFIFWDDFESGQNPQWNWAEAGDYWHIENVTSSNYTSPVNVLRCSNKTTDVYERNNTGSSEAYTDIIALENINLQDFDWAELTFAYRNNVYTDDKFKVLVHIPGEEFGYEIYFDSQYVDPQLFVLGEDLNSGSMWNYTYDLTSFCGYDRIDVHFVFDASLTLSNMKPGVFIDDVNITGTRVKRQDGQEISFKVNDEYFYYFMNFNPGWFSDVFGMSTDFGWDPDYEHYENYEGGDEEATEDPNQIKIKVMSIIEEPDFWRVTVRFWWPFENFDSIGAGEEMEFRVYKNALNFKGGCDFFIPNNDIYKYLQKADNYDSGGDFSIQHYDYIDSQSIRMWYDEFDIELRFNNDGILEMFSLNRPGYGLILEFFLRNDDCEDCDNYNDGGGMMIPGYDLLITISACCLVSIVLVRRVKRKNNN